MYFCYHSPIGELYLEMEGEALTGIWFHDGRFSPAPNTFCRDVTPFLPVIHWLDCYFKGECPELPEIAMDMKGSAFQQAVWEQLRQIPYGHVTTYGAIAKVLEEKLGHKVAPQAVGGAVGRNPVSILVPCHRVVGAGGKLTGYGGGLWRKEYLLVLETKNT